MMVANKSLAEVWFSTWPNSAQIAPRQIRAAPRPGNVIMGTNRWVRNCLAALGLFHVATLEHSHPQTIVIYEIRYSLWNTIEYVHQGGIS